MLQAACDVVALLAPCADISTARLIMVLASCFSVFFFKWMLLVDKVQPSSALSGKLPVPSSLQDLTLLLTQEGNISTSGFGIGVAKTLSSLWEELRSGECALERGSITGRLTRVVEPVFVVLHFDGKILVEASQVLPDGRERDRRMLLAEKKTLSDRTPMQAAIRGLWKELRLGTGCEEGLPDRFSYCKDQDVCFLEEIDSASYPGLPCVYHNHQIHFDIHLGEDGLSILGKDSDFWSTLDFCGILNLPHCTPFETVEFCDSHGGVLRHRWEWVDVAEAKQKRVKGMHLT